MTATAVRAAPAAPKTEQRFIEHVLDDLEVTERAYHHLNFSVPLVAELVRRARCAADPGDRVLLVGGSAVLAEALVRLGYQLDIWQFPRAYLTDAMRPLVSRTIHPEELDTLDPGDARYALIIVPLVLEALRGPEAFLRAIRPTLAPNGRVLLATANQSRLAARLAAVTGRPFASESAAPTLSLSWPALATLRQRHRDELTAIGRAAGFCVCRCDFVTAERAFLEMEPLNVQGYLARKVRRLATQCLPATRDAIVMELTPRVGDNGSLRTSAGQPMVSVYVAAHCSGDRLRATLGCLVDQTYPSAGYEVVVMHDGSRHDVPAIVADAASTAACVVRDLVLPDADGPAARNQAMAEARGDIAAHTDDSCNPPPDWIQAAVNWFDADTAVVSGPVFALPGSEARWLDLPGTRPDPDDKGVPSRVIFPITNVFYRTPVALAAGGFDQALAGGPVGPALGWDTALAWRLRRSGWGARYREEVYQFRLFPTDAGRADWITKQMRRATELPALVAAVPEYGEQALMTGVFASKQTMNFDLALAGVAGAAATRRWPLLLLVAPWLAGISQRVDLWPARAWPGSARTVARIAVRHGVWLIGLTRGSIRARRIVL